MPERTPELTFVWDDAGNHEEVLIAYVGQAQVGSLVIGNSRISELAVNPEWRRRGIATALYQEALEEWGELEHGLLTDEGKAWLAHVEPDSVFERDPVEPDLWMVR